MNALALTDVEEVQKTVETLRELIEMAVADYGFRLAVMWGPDDVIAMSSLTRRGSVGVET